MLVCVCEYGIKSEKKKKKKHIVFTSTTCMETNTECNAVYLN